jgi:hypothetical protein
MSSMQFERGLVTDALTSAEIFSGDDVLTCDYHFWRMLQMLTMPCSTICELMQRECSKSLA